ncbi:UNVERIFIED_CONTAM: Mitochondrial uncoupling protein 5 [Sesamum angustifolium]|uniref:Mitochondrial uncoupling protein 5 n=1 Tax=Sesamum angustifolium TaxID=2727405 RepID=A0AAW2NKI1_9LAMI
MVPHAADAVFPSASQLQERGGRNYSDEQERGNRQPVAWVVPHSEPSDAGDGVAAGVLRPVQGDDFGEGSDEGRTGDTRHGKLRSGVRGGGGVEPGGRDQDTSDEHEGGGGMAAPYSGAVDCAMKTIKAEGPMALYKGFIPTISRQGPFTVVLFVTLEQVRKLFKDF